MKDKNAFLVIKEDKLCPTADDNKLIFGGRVGKRSPECLTN